MPYEDEIMKELEEGKTYPESTIYNLLYNKNVIIISQSCSHFNASSSRNFTVIKKSKGYMHYCDNDNVYVIPPSEATIYFID